MPKCECGNERGSASACPRCRFLDGTRSFDQLLVGVMRERTRVTTTEIERLLGVANETASRVLNRLVHRGRARRDMADDGTGHGAATYALISPRSMEAA